MRASAPAPPASIAATRELYDEHIDAGRPRKEMNMSRTLKNPAAIHPAPGFHHIAISKGSTQVHFAGQVALDTEFNVVGETLYEQTQAAMRNLEIAMDEAGVTWEDLVRRTVYTTEPTEFQTITEAIHSVTDGAEDPAQTIIGVTGLAIPGLVIEIECTAVID